MKKINQLVKKHKLILIIVILIVFASLIVGIPSLAKLKNRNTIYTVSSWDGSVATSYRKGNGTKENPYIISNGSELAFFIKQSEDPEYSYEGEYFELSNDIVINSGIFEYSETEGIKYILDGRTYYVKENTNEYYDNVNRAGNSVGTFNVFETIKNFKGNFNGNSFTIFGLQIGNSNKEKVALFENLEGTVSDLYVTNSLTYGNGEVAGLAINANKTTLSNVLYDGFIINKGLSKINETNIDSISITGMVTETTSTVTLPPIAIEGTIKSIKLIGEYDVSNLDSVNTIKINEIDIQSNSFELDLTGNELNEIPVVVTSSIEGTVINFKNIKYQVEYYDDMTAGLIVNSTDTTINNTINKAEIYGNYISSGFIVKTNGELKILQSYNNGNVKSNYISSGLVSIVKENEKEITLTNIYNTGVITSPTSGGIISLVVDNTGIININNAINISNNYEINTVINSVINVLNSYSVDEFVILNGILEGNFVQTPIENLYNKDFLTSISYNPFISFTDVLENTSNAWIYENNSLPILYIDDLNNPIANINITTIKINNIFSNFFIVSSLSF